MSVWSVLLPGERPTLVLRACAADEPEAHEAFDRWLAGAPDPCRELAGVRGTPRLVPALAQRVRAGGWQPPPALATHLAAAALREEARWGAIETIATHLFERLEDAGVEALAIQGLAAAAFYPRPALRHTHDLDVLVRSEAVAQAVAEAERAGFEAAHPSEPRRRRHRSGLGLVLHRRPCALDIHTALDDAAWRTRVRPTPRAGGFPRASAAQILAQRLVHATVGRHRETLTWALDAWWVHGALDDAAWEELERTVADAGASLPVAALLGYLADDLGCTVPREVRRRMEARAAAAGPEAWDWALRGALRGERRGLRALLASAGPAELPALARWLLLPSPAYLRAMHAQAPDEAVWALAMRRWRTGARRVIAGLVRRVRPPTASPV